MQQSPQHYRQRVVTAALEGGDDGPLAANLKNLCACAVQAVVRGHQVKREKKNQFTARFAE